MPPGQQRPDNSARTEPLGYNIYIVRWEAILALPAGADRTAALAAWFQGLFPVGKQPVLVGGAAVELFTGGAYTTGDLDFVGSVPASVGARLEEHGFRRSGRHWVHEREHIFIELPSSSLLPGERAVDLRRGKTTVRVVAPEELVVDRLAAWQFWGSEQDAVNAFLIWRSNRMNEKRLRTLAAGREVSVALASLVAFRGALAGKDPTPEQLIEWAKEKRW